MTPVQKEAELRSLFTQWLNGTVDEPIIHKLADYAEDPEMTTIWYSLLEGLPPGSISSIQDSEQEATLQKVYQNLVATQPELNTRKPVMLFSGWMKYAAAMLIMTLGGLAWYFSAIDGKHKDVADTGATQNGGDILTNTNKALLTLSDGRTILLDTTSNGQLAHQTGAQIFKLQDGHVVYQTDSTQPSSGKSPALNTISTPNGGEYSIVLSDGTKVWLNALSSITFPTAFTGPARTVSIKGEVYFEVAKNAAAPFRVTINKEVEVEVLGTHFNVNAYDDEASINTTLLEGKVRVKSLGSSVTLTPGRQASVLRSADRGANITTHLVNTDQALAWRKGRFNFEGKGLKDAMKELKRWYDIEVVYEEGVPDIVFGGKIDRKLKLHQLLNGLQNMGVKFTLTENGHRLIIAPEK